MRDFWLLLANTALSNIREAGGEIVGRVGRVGLVGLVGLVREFVRLLREQIGLIGGFVWFSYCYVWLSKWKDVSLRP